MIFVIQKMIDRSVKKYLDALPLQDMIDKSVKRYMETLPHDKMVKSAKLVIGSEEFSKEALQVLIDEAKGDKVVQIYYKGGDMVQVSNRASSQSGGPGW